MNSILEKFFVEMRQIKFLSRMEDVVSNMKATEKTIFYGLCVILVTSSLSLLYKVNNYFLVEIPSSGGELREGTIGSPRFINPVLSISDTDKDLTSIIYSGLVKIDENGFVVPDLAKSYSISEDGKTYTFILKDDAYFHDNKKVTVDDIIFTIDRIKDPVIKSPKSSSWLGVQIQKISDTEISFTINKPYSPFIDSLTLGILPKHVWKDITSEEFAFSEWNIKPIGSGPYKVSSVSKNSGGIPNSITLTAWKKYVFGRPFIDNIIFTFYQNENDINKAYQNNDIDNILLSDSSSKIKEQKKENNVQKSILPRVFGLFFNQNLSQALLQKEVRVALLKATPKDRIINDVLSGEGVALSGPIPTDIEENDILNKEDIEGAREYLLKSGWKANSDGILEKKTKSETIQLAFDITTTSNPELKETAEILAETWNKIGAKVEVKIFEPSDLSQNIIKGRKYEALLFGEVVKEIHDLYPFWHSAERNDPGLNIALYTNLTADKILEKIQSSQDSIKNEEYYKELKQEIVRDVPAIFLFSPKVLYLVREDVKNIILDNVIYRQERFSGVHKWYIETDKVWKFFVK